MHIDSADIKEDASEIQMRDVHQLRHLCHKYLIKVLDILISQKSE